MLKLLSKLFSKVLTSLPKPIEPKIYDDGLTELTNEEKAELSRRKKNFRAFIQAITPHLTKGESQRLGRLGTKAIDEEYSSLEALEEVISNQKLGRWVFINIDWKAIDEIAWQASEILSLYGVEDKWEDVNHTKYSETIQSFNDLGTWLNPRGFSLVHIQNDGDSYCSIIVKTSTLSAVKDLAHLAEIRISE